LPVDSSDKEHLSETTSSDDQLRVVLMHGKEKSPDDIWYPWLHQTLDERGISCVIPELPNPSDPDFRERIGALSDCKPDEQTVLIGHAR
jgi:predicted alpha/beta hydrolase family esterase